MIHYREQENCNLWSHNRIFLRNCGIWKSIYLILGIISDVNQPINSNFESYFKFSKLYHKSVSQSTIRSYYGYFFFFVLVEFSEKDIN